MASLSRALKQDVLRFIDDLEVILESHDISTLETVYVRVYMQGLSYADCMQHIITNFLPWSGQIKEKNEEFFHKNKEIFGKLPSDKVNYFSDLIRQGKLSEEEKDIIWQFCASFVAYGEEFQKKRTVTVAS